MKKLITIMLLFWATAGFVCAQTCQNCINYQAVLRDAAGNLVTTGTVNLEISIHDAISGGNNLYDETHSVSPNQFGIANLKIGSSPTVVSGNYNMIDWNSGNKYIQIRYNGAIMGSRSQLVSVPFALHANNGVPAGTVVAFMGDTTQVPQGWLICDGKAVSQTAYNTLFGVLQTKCGNAGGTAGMFNLPDLRGQFLRGYSGNSNTDPDKGSRTAMKPGGVAANNVGSVQGDEFENHNHTLTDPGHNHIQNVTSNCGGGLGVGHRVDHNSDCVSGDAQSFNQNIPTNNSSTNITIAPSGNSSETRPKNAYVLYIIKY